MTKFAFEPWAVTEEGFSAAALPENESVFALGNGFIGLRGNLEEGSASGADTIQGSFLNAVFDSEPIRYGETAYGTKLLIAREVGNDTDFVDILSVYEGYSIEFVMTPNPEASIQELSEVQIQMCVDFLSELDFVAAS